MWSAPLAITTVRLASEIAYWSSIRREYSETVSVALLDRPSSGVSQR
jgi:hypothetical protein